MSSLAAAASLAVAVSDLKVVQGVIGAIRNADRASAAAKGSSTPAPSIANRRHLHPEPVYEERKHFHPEPVYHLPRVIHPHQRIEQQVLASAANMAPLPEHTFKHESPIQPPWKVQPWKIPTPSKQTIKIHRPHTDVVVRGSLIDLFV